MAAHYMCDYCGFESYNREKWKKHMKRAHPGF